jgi:excisionase family DNA binding protein
MTNSPPADTPWRTRQEAAAYLRVTLNTFDRWVGAGRLRRYYPDGLQTPRFKVSDLDDMMQPQPLGAAE